MQPLVVTHLKKIYAKGFEAVKDVSLSISKGECLGLLGPNGAGKSTSIQCITGSYPPTSGEVLINGIDVQKNPKAARKVLGVCPQEDTLDSDFNVLDQMIRHATFFRISIGEGRKNAEELLKLFKLEDKSEVLVEMLSGGMKRRLQVARALVSKPSVLVLDEPTTGLDPEARRILWDVIVQYRSRGLAILLCTHYMDEAERLCDRVAIISKGEILETAPPRDLIQKYFPQDLIEEEIRPGVKWKRPQILKMFI